MEEILNQIALIKQEFGIANKELQAEVLNTAALRKTSNGLQDTLESLQLERFENERRKIMWKIDVDDAECKLVRAKERLEEARRQTSALRKELDQELARQAELAKQVDEMKGPDDYKRELLEKRSMLDDTRKELEAEQNTAKKLSHLLSALEQARARSHELEKEIAPLKDMKTKLMKDIAAMEQKQAARTQQESIPQLQRELEEAQARFQYLCAYQQAMQ